MKENVTIKYMKIAVIGGGFTGLAAAYALTKKGHHVTVFERDAQLGGLAIGWKEKHWNWSLEKAYHHLFTNDTAIRTLIKNLGISDKIIIKRPITANLLPSNSKPRFDDGETVRMVQLDSPLNLLQFPGLSLVHKLRTGAIAAFCKVYPFWQTLEGVTAKEFFIRWGGRAGWKVIWEPLMIGKFGALSDTIAASWLWARIHKRTPSLVYIEGGFQTLVDTLATAIQKNEGTIITSAEIVSIENVSGSAYRVLWKKQHKNTQYSIQNTQYDKILLTTPTPIAQKLMPGVASSSSLTIPHLSAQVLVLETDTPILRDIYWLSITDRSFPFLAVVAHTNFMDKKYYGGHHLTYIGNYLPNDHKYLKMTKDALLKEFLPYIRRICPTMNDERITNAYLFTAPFAQPVHEVHYSQRAPQLTTPIDGVYLANMDSIYPWDRGTNYAVELGIRAAATIMQETSKDSF